MSQLYMAVAYSQEWHTVHKKLGEEWELFDNGILVGLGEFFTHTADGHHFISGSR